MKIKIVNKSNNPTPSYAKTGDAAVDIRADFSHGINTNLGENFRWDENHKVLDIHPGGRALIPTGLYTEFDHGYIQILSRSGLAIKKGIQVLAGVIDSGYRNEIGVVLLNTGSSDFEVHEGDRIAQMTWIPVEPIEFEEVSELSDSDRGENGFGSSGVK